MEEKAAGKSGKIFDSQTLKRLFPYIRPYRGSFYFLIGLTVFLGFLSPIRPILIQYAIDGFVEKGDYAGLLNLVLVMMGLLLLQAIGTYYQTYLSTWLGQTIIMDIRKKLYAHILSLRIRFFDHTQIGRLVTRNISDIETIADVFSEGLAAMSGDLLQLVFILAYMFYIDWRLTLVSLSMLPLLLFSTWIFKEKIKETFNEVRTAVASLNTFVQEHITGMSVVQAFAAEDREFAKFKDINARHRKANVRSVLYYSVYFPVAEVISAIGTGLLVWYGSRGVLEGQFTLGMITAFILYIGMFFRPIRAIADRFNTLQLGLVSTERILSLLDHDDVMPDNGQLQPDTIQGKIEFRKVGFSYVENQPVLSDISFEVPAGKSLALVGATGSGKSTIVNLLTRFYEQNEGEILVDGQPVESYPLPWLRRKVGMVLQDVFLFRGSIFDNITLGSPDISIEQAKEAAKLVGADRFIEQLPGGYHYEVMERGSTLSVGQRQLISFVRAMVHNPAVLVLDEATSSVDTDTEELIQQAIARIMEGRTSIVVAHRLSTIQKADEILVLDKGRILERGRHESLLKSGGAYAGLYEAQYREYQQSKPDLQ
jgi:ATP-binding cassette subfamily B multidrug efflux pump